MFIAKKPTDEMFKEGLSLNIFASALDENQVLKVADRRLVEDYEYSTQSSSTDYHIHSDGSSANTHLMCKAVECTAAIIRVGLCCTVQQPKDRWTMRQASTKLQGIRQTILGL